MDILNMLAFLVGGSITITSFIMVVGKIFTAPVTQTAQEIKTSLWRSFFIGLVNAVFFILVASLLFNLARGLNGFLAGLVAMIAVAIFAALGILASIGLSGFGLWVEGRFFNEEQTLASSLKSSALLVLSCMAPFVGWFLLTPFVIATGLGAAIQFLFRKKEKVV